MRGRNKPWADDFIKNNQDFIFNKSRLTNKEFQIEIGMGKGDFILAKAKNNPNIDYLGVELNKSIFALALKKIVLEKLDNLTLLQTSAIHLLDYLPEKCVSKIYLNFSDPWPKARHEKRRLVHPSFLGIYEKLLIKNGYLYLKTDNEKLFDYALEQFTMKNYTFISKTRNYDILEDDDFMTEYESKFRSLNQPIYRVVVQIKGE